MKINGKQIVVELPDKRYCAFHKDNSEWFVAQAGKSCEYCFAYKTRNDALSEVARMNPALEVDEAMLNKITFGLACDIQAVYDLEIATVPEVEKMIKDALASDPSKWMKRKE